MPAPVFRSWNQIALEYEAALTALRSGAISSYSLPTGVSVTRHNIAELEREYRLARKLAWRSYAGPFTVADQSGGVP